MDFILSWAIIIGFVFILFGRVFTVLWAIIIEMLRMTGMKI